MEILCLLLCGLVGYLLGAIPFALVISKIFFKIDVRDYGSHNAGGTNAGRVMGKKIGLLVIILDALKIPLVFGLNILIIKLGFGHDFSEMFYTYCQLFSAFTTVLGHSYPIYFHFKGGKAVSCTAGTIVFTNFLIAPIGLLFFFIVLKKWKMVSLGSILGSFLCVILSFIPPVAKIGMWFFIQYDIVYPLTVLMIFLVLLVRHSENIKRIKRKEESKITWLK